MSDNKPSSFSKIDLNKYAAQKQFVVENDLDTNLLVGTDQEQARARHQGFTSELGNGLAKAALKIPGNIVSNLASIVDIEDYYNQDTEIGNTITNFIQDKVNPLIDENFAVHRENPNKSFDLGDSAWWVENGTSLAGSVAEFAATGGILGSALKGLNIAGKAATGLTALALNQAEAIGSARDVYKTAYDLNLKKTGNIEEAKKIAADAAAYTININRLNLPLNLSSASLFGKTAAGTRKLINKARVEGAKRLLEEGAQEYGEEVINYIGEQEGARRGRGEQYSIGNTIRDIFSEQGIEAGVLGFVGGAGQTGGTHVVNNFNGINKDHNERYKAQQERLAELDELAVAHGGQRIKDVLADVHVQSNFQNKIYEAEASHNDGVADEYKNQLLQYQAVKSFETGTTDKLLRTLEAVKTQPGVTGEEIVKYNEGIQKVKDWENIYNQHIGEGTPKEKITHLFNNKVEKDNITKNIKANNNEIRILEGQIADNNLNGISSQQEQDKLDILKEKAKILKIDELANAADYNQIRSKDFDATTYSKKKYQELAGETEEEATVNNEPTFNPPKVEQTQEEVIAEKKIAGEELTEEETTIAEANPEVIDSIVAEKQAESTEEVDQDYIKKPSSELVKGEKFFVEKNGIRYHYEKTDSGYKGIDVTKLNGSEKTEADEVALNAFEETFNTHGLPTEVRQLGKAEKKETKKEVKKEETPVVETKPVDKTKEIKADAKKALEKINKEIKSTQDSLEQQKGFKEPDTSEINKLENRLSNLNDSKNNIELILNTDSVYSTRWKTSSASGEGLVVNNTPIDAETYRTIYNKAAESLLEKYNSEKVKDTKIEELPISSNQEVTFNEDVKAGFTLDKTTSRLREDLEKIPAEDRTKNQEDNLRFLNYVDNFTGNPKDLKFKVVTTNDAEYESLIDDSEKTKIAELKAKDPNYVGIKFIVYDNNKNSSTYNQPILVDGKLLLTSPLVNEIHDTNKIKGEDGNTYSISPKHFLRELGIKGWEQGAKHPKFQAKWEAEVARKNAFREQLESGKIKFLNISQRSPGKLDNKGASPISPAAALFADDINKIKDGATPRYFIPTSGDKKSKTQTVSNKTTGFEFLADGETRVLQVGLLYAIKDGVVYPLTSRKLNGGEVKNIAAAFELLETDPKPEIKLRAISNYVFLTNGESNYIGEPVKNYGENNLYYNKATKTIHFGTQSIPITAATNSQEFLTFLENRKRQVDTKGIKENGQVQVIKDGGETTKADVSYYEFLFADKGKDGKTPKDPAFTIKMHPAGERQVTNSYFIFDSKNPVTQPIATKVEEEVESSPFKEDSEIQLGVDGDADATIRGKEKVKTPVEAITPTPSDKSSGITEEEAKEVGKKVTETKPPLLPKEELPDTGRVRGGLGRRAAKENGTENKDDTKNNRLAGKKRNYVAEDIKKVTEWYKKQFSDTDLKITQELIDGKAFGQFYKNITYLYERAENGTLYHEAFHKVTQQYLTEKETQALYDETGIKNPKEAEEFLAEDFRNYMLNGQKAINGKPVRNTLFRRLWRMIKAFVTGKKDIAYIYEKLAGRGFASDKKVRSSNEKLNRFGIFNESKSKEWNDSITSILFDALFAERFTPAQLTDSDDRAQLLVDAYDAVYFDLEDKYKATQDAEYAKEVLWILKNFDTVIEQHIKTLNDLIDITVKEKSEGKDTKVAEERKEESKEEGEEDKETTSEEITAGKSNAWDISNEIASVSTASNNTKMLLATLKQRDKNGETIPNTLGEPKLVEFNEAYSFLLRNLKGISSMQGMYNKIKSLVAINPSMQSLVDRLHKPSEIADLNNHEMQLWLDLWQDFHKAESKGTLTIIDKQTGDIYQVDANRHNLEERIKDDWRNDLVNSPYTDKSGSANTLKKEVTDIENPIEFLEAIGITFENWTAEELQESVGEKEFETKVDYIRDLVKEAIKTDKPVNDLFALASETGKSKGNLTDLLSLAAEKSTKIVELSYINAEGKRIYSISLNDYHSLVSNAINEANTWEELLESMPQLNSVSSKGSVWLDELFPINPKTKERDKKAKNAKVSVDTIAGIRIEGEQDSGEVITKADVATKFLQEFNDLFQTGKATIPRTADKSLDKVAGLEKSRGDVLVVPINDIERKGFKTPKVREVFVGTAERPGYFLAELERIQLFNSEGLGKTIDIYNKKAGNWTIFEDILSESTKKELAPYMENNETPTKEILDNVANDTAVFLESISITGNPKYANSFGSIKQMMEQFKLVKGEKTPGIASSLTAKNSVDNLARTFAVNHFIQTIEYHKVIVGDKAFFKDPFKRYSMSSATKKFCNNDEVVNEQINKNRKVNSHNFEYAIGKNVRATVLADNNVKSNFVDQYIAVTEKRLIDSGIAESVAKLQAEQQHQEYNTKKGKGAMNEADAQAFTNPVFHRRMLIKAGLWNYSKQEKQYEYEMAYMYKALHERASESKEEQLKKYGNEYNQFALTPEEVTKYDTILAKGNPGNIINIQKGQYFGAQAGKRANNLNAPTGHKLSYAPLTWRLVEGTNLEDKLINLLENQVDYMVFESGVKLGSPVKKDGSKPSFYDEEGKGNILSKAEIDGTEETLGIAQLLPYQYLGIQVEIEAKAKEEVIFGSQFRKLFESNLFDNGQMQVPELQGLHDRYQKLVRELAKAEWDSLVKELGVELNADESLKDMNVTKLVELLKKEGESRQLANNLVEALKVDSNGNLVYPIDSLVNRNKLEALMVSLVSSRVVRQKMPGDALIQMSGIGFENKGSRKQGVSNDLKGYRVDSVTGKTLPIQIKVSMNAQYKTLLEKYGSIKGVNQAIKDGDIPKEALTLVGYRIPTQGLNSIEFMEIVGFTSDSQGNSIIMPSEVVAKSGGDFDIDKLNIFRPNFYLNKSGKIKLSTNEKEAKQNEIIATAKQMLEHEYMFEQLITANTTSDMDVTVDAVRYAEYKSTLKESEKPMTQEAYIKSLDNPISGTQELMVGHIMNQFRDFLGGKQAVPMDAVHITAHLLFQQAGTKIAKVSNKGEVFINMDVNKNTVGDYLLGQRFNKNKKLISDIFSQIANLHLDAAKDPKYKDINLTQEILSTAHFLNHLGAPEDTVIYFIKQPVILELLAAEKQILVDKLEKSEYVNHIQNLKVKYAKLAGLKFDAKTNTVEPYDKVILGTEGTNELLLDNIAGNMDAKLQLQVLEDFENYREYAQSLGSLMKAVNYDTTRFKNLSAVEDRIDLIKGFGKDENRLFSLQDYKDLMNKSVVGAFDKTKGTLSMFSHLFVTQNPEVKKVRDSIINEVQPKGKLAESLPTIIDNDFIGYITQRFGTYQGKPLYTHIDRLFRGKNSLAHQLKDIKDIVGDNYLLEQLQGILADDVNNIKVHTKKLTKHESDVLTDLYRELSEYDGSEAVKVQNFMQDLTTFGILQSGIHNSPITFLGLIPNEFYGDITKNAIETYKKLPNKEKYHEDFKERFFLKNSNNTQIVPNAKDFQGNVIKRNINKLFTQVEETRNTDKKNAAGYPIKEKTGKVTLYKKGKEYTLAGVEFRKLGHRLQDFYLQDNNEFLKTGIEDKPTTTPTTPIGPVDKVFNPETDSPFFEDATSDINPEVVNTTEKGNTKGKTVVVLEGSSATNLPIFEDEKNVYLMNDGQQEAYDFIHTQIAEKLAKRTTFHVQDLVGDIAFEDGLAAQYDNLIPEAMWNNMIGLAGRGGTGKTTVIKKIIEDLAGENKYSAPRVIYLTPTHTAATVLQESLGINSESTAGDVSTISSATMRSVPKGNSLELVSEGEYIESLKYKLPLSQTDIIVFDESSMISKQQIDDIKLRLEHEYKSRNYDYTNDKYNDKVMPLKMPIFIFMGDYRQLGPVEPGNTKANTDVNKGPISSTVLTNPEKTSELTQVMRSKSQHLHDIYDAVGNQIMTNMGRVSDHMKPIKLNLNEYDELTNKSTEDILVVNNADGVIDDYTDYLVANNNPYGMFWIHYNNISHAYTKDMFAKIRQDYFNKLDEAGLVTDEDIEEKSWRDYYKGDYVEYIGNLEISKTNGAVVPDFENKPYVDKLKNGKIEKGQIKPRARFKVIDIFEDTVELKSLLSEDVFKLFGGDNLDINREVSVLYNRQDKVRALATPLDLDVEMNYNKGAKGYDVIITNTKSGNSISAFVHYAAYKRLKLDDVFAQLSTKEPITKKLSPSYIGSAHTAQGNSIKNVIVGEYNIKQNLAKGVNQDDAYSGLYTAITRTSSKLVLIKDGAIENNQEVFTGFTEDKGKEVNTTDKSEIAANVKAKENAKVLLDSGTPIKDIVDQRLSTLSEQELNALIKPEVTESSDFELEESPFEDIDNYLNTLQKEYGAENVNPETLKNSWKKAQEMNWSFDEFKDQTEDRLDNCGSI